MANTRERAVTHGDLDIFGGMGEEAPVENGSEGDMDIFWGAGTEEAKAEGAAADENATDEKKEGEETPGTDGEPDWASIFGEGSDSETKEPEGETEGKEGWDEKLDPEIDKLLTDAENADDKDERDDIIKTLRGELVDKQVELDTLTRHRDALNNKLMASSSSDTELGLYKDSISTLDSNPKLRALVKLANSSEETAKNRRITILADMLEELTGQDIGGVLDKNRGDAIKGVLGAGSSKTDAGESKKEEKWPGANELW